jgi:AraC-like DNA-binding protein
MPKKPRLGKTLDEILADLEVFLAVRDVFAKGVMMDSLIDILFLRHLEGYLEKVKLSVDGYMELVPKKAYGKGSCFLKPAGKKIVVNITDLIYQQPITHIVEGKPEYFYISLCHGTMRGIVGGYVRKGDVYNQRRNAGFCYSGHGVAFLPDFLDSIVNSHPGISPDEIVRAFDALGRFPLIPDAAVILKQLDNASFTGDVGSVWIEAKALELVSVILDWHRRLAAAAAPPLREQDRLGIDCAIRYVEEHFSGPLTLEALAKQAAMSISKFTAAFKTHTGLSAASYIRRIRMDQAMYLLKNSTASLSDIAGMVGYKHYSRFFTLFCEQFGVRPGEFRKRE